MVVYKCLIEVHNGVVHFFYVEVLNCVWGDEWNSVFREILTFDGLSGVFV